MKLYSYYRSTAAYRVRIAMLYKQIEHEIIAVNLIQNEQSTPEYKQHNPHGRVPCLQDGDWVIGQSLAILEYLEEIHPNPSLLPSAPKDRAWVRYFANIICCDMHPLNNVSVIQYLKNNMGHSQVEAMTWYHHWLKNGFDALDTLLENNLQAGRCCLGDTISLADVCLIPQIYNAQRFDFSMDAYPRLQAVNDYCLSLPYFDQAKPENQIDYVERKGSVTP